MLFIYKKINARDAQTPRKEKLNMKYDLQFFADDIDTDVDSTGAEEPEYADQVETVNEEVNETSEESTPGADSPSTENTDIDRNAIYANARRRAEAEVRKRQAEEDARFAERFKGLTNPETHQPITTTAEYFEALDAWRDGSLSANKAAEMVGISRNTFLSWAREET